MGETDKPFACTNEGCQMTFTNEDHLNVHRKKHDMVLNLGLTCKNIVTADQTPTPTRFIRNCEEVGLFQDLQNVNPFEETFRKAIEHSKIGIIHVPNSPNGDSLHTPQIFQHLSENNISKSLQITDQHFDESSTIDDDLLKVDSQDSPSKDDCLSPLQNCRNIKDNHFSYSTELTRSDENCYELSSSNSNDTSVEDVSIIKKNLNNYLLKSNTTETKSDVKKKIKEVLHNKKKSEIKPLDLKVKDRDFSVSTVKKPRQRINLKSKLKTLINTDADNNKTDCQRNLNFYDKDLNEVEKRRVMNRMAQMRSRKRKKMWLDQMEQEIEKLKTDNKLLITENQKLKEENILLKSMLLKHNSCSFPSDLKIQNGAVSTQIMNEKKLIAIQPKPVLYTTYPIQSSQTNVKTSQEPSDIIVGVQKSLPKLLPKNKILVNQFNNENGCENIFREDGKQICLDGNTSNDKVLNLTNIRIPQTILFQVKTTKT